MPKPKERPADKSARKPAGAAAKALPKPLPKAPVKSVAKAKPAPVIAKKTAPAAKPVKTAAKPVAKAKTVPAAKKPVKVAKAVPAKPVGKAAVKASAPKAAVAKPAPAKPAPTVKSSAAPAKAAAVAVIKTATAPAKVAKEVKPIPAVAKKAETKPVVTAKPVVEKNLRTTKLPAVPASKVVKMSKTTSANGHAPNGSHKCPFNTEELSDWRKLLLSRRSEISSDIDALEKDAMESEDGHTTPLHAAERGSDADLQDVSLGLAGEEKDLLWQIDRALRKIDQAAPLPFGLCEHTGESIPRQRLQLIPWTPLSIEGATHMEESGLTIEDMLIDD